MKSGTQFLTQLLLPIIALQVNASQVVGVNALYPPTEGAASPNNVGDFEFYRSGSDTIRFHLSWSGTASSSDYTDSLPSYIDVPNGFSNGFQYIHAIDDSIYEGTETVICTITSAENLNRAETITIQKSSDTLNIYDNDKPTVTVSALGDTCDTGSCATAGWFQFHRTGNASGTLTVHWTIGGTATQGPGSGEDYEYVGTSAAFASGSSDLNVYIYPYSEDGFTHLADGTETVVFTVSSDSSYNIGSPSSSTVYIY